MFEEVDNTVFSKLTRDLLETLEGQIRHGFGEISITCEIGKGKKRYVLLKHGTSRQYVIPMEELALLNTVSR